MKTWHATSAIFVVLALATGLTACGGGNSSPPLLQPLSISVSPSAASVPAGGSQQFQAVVSNAANATVTWKVNGIEGGNAAAGTISSSGLYVAPAQLATPAQATIEAVLQADPSKSASATVSIPAIGVNISPQGGVVEVGTTVQDSAIVTNSVDQSVIWQVNGIAGGNSSVGAISAGGLYTAPASVADATPVTVSAISVADSSKSGSTQISVVPVITIAISPGSTTVPAGGTQQFTAMVQGTSNTLVTWNVPAACDEDGSCTPEFGSISDGLYSAPPYPPRGDHTFGGVCAISNVNPAKAACAQVTVSYSNASLNGPYAFSLRGQNATGELLVAGSFTADGNGKLTSGVEDIANAPSPPVTNLPFGGSYSIDADGRGTATITSANATSTLRFLLVDGDVLCCVFAVPASEALVIGFDSLAVTEGRIERQFGSNGLFHGVGNSDDFAFGLSGSGPSGNIVAAGRFTSSAGIGAAGPISTGLEDVNNTGSVARNESFTGTYDENLFSRGTLTLTGAFGTRHFAYYPGAENDVMIIGLDPDFAVLGQAQLVFSGDFAGGINNSALGHQYVIERSGISAGVPFLSLGQFGADGAGTITTGIADENSGGSVTQDVSFTGKYALAATGRGTMTLTTPAGDASLSFYIAGQPAALKAFLVQTDTSMPTGGAFFLSGDSVPLGPAGLLLSDLLPTQRRTLGLIQVGTQNLNGTADVNDSGATLSGVALSGVYSLPDPSRGTVTISTPSGDLQFRIYGSPFFEKMMIGLNPGAQQRGILRQQF